MKIWVLMLAAGWNFSLAAVHNNISAAISVYKPFVIQEEDGRLAGVYHEYISKLAKKAGLEASFEIMPTSRMLTLVTKGAFDSFIFVSGIPEAQKNYIEVMRFHKIQMTLIAKDKKFKFDKKVLVVGKPVGHFCPMIRKEQEKYVKFYEYKNTEQAMKMMLANRMDALCTSREIFYYELKHSAYAKAKVYELTDYRYDFVISLFVNKKLPAQRVNSITKAALELEKKKTIPMLYKKYGVPDPKSL